MVNVDVAVTQRSKPVDVLGTGVPLGSARTVQVENAAREDTKHYWNRDRYSTSIGKQQDNLRLLCTRSVKKS
jgi:hypothetical protein